MGLGFRVRGLGLRVCYHCFGFRVRGLGFIGLVAITLGSGFRVRGLGFIGFVTITLGLRGGGPVAVESVLSSGV